MKKAKASVLGTPATFSSAKRQERPSVPGKQTLGRR